MTNNGDDSLIRIDDEGEIVDDDEDECQVIEAVSTHHDLFVVDTNHVQEDDNTAFLFDEDIAIHRVVMPSSGDDADASKARKSGGGMQCFNCNGPHTLNDCPEPKDQRRISQNRAARYNRSQGRFHEDSNKGFRPGYISDDLRDALGIRSVTELLNFIHADTEEGEVEDQSAMAKNIEPEKIVLYPGFNAPTPRNCKDMDPAYRIPHLEDFVQEQQRHLDEMVAEKRRLRELEEAKKSRKRRADQADSQKDDSISSSSSVQVIDDDEAPADSGVSMETASSSSSLSETTSPTKKVRKEGPVSIGTPVLARRAMIGGGDEPEAVKPSLEAFAEGVVPFQAKEESSEHKGFFRKIMGMVKGLKKK
ncbi:PSP family protein [Aphelenchoides avenae]|nr:PSP family protein [Aphelenchus avenae]